MNQIQFLLREFVLTPFGLLAFFFFLTKILAPSIKRCISNLDDLSTKIIGYAGILYFGIWASELLIELFLTENEYESYALRERLLGPYSFGIWLQPLFWFVFSQCFYFRPFKNSVVFKLLFSLSVIFTFEKLAIAGTYLHLDYLPNSLTHLGLNWQYPTILLFNTLIYSTILISLNYFLKPLKKPDE